MLKTMLVFCLATVVQANVRDVVMPAYVPATGCVCSAWASISNSSEQARINEYWSGGKPPENAGSSCAMPAASAGRFECDGCTVDKIYNSFQGPWCYCEGGSETYCEPPNGVPEQINLQIAAPDVVVASFVTFDTMKTPGAPVAMLGTSEDNMWPLTGVQHPYAALSKIEARNYTLNFVRFADLLPRQTYFYKVKGGALSGVWSPIFKFRAPYSAGETRIAAYGDMGHSHYNNMENMADDCVNGKIDAILHMGDHAYDLGNSHSKRGDAYMNAFQATLSGCPWLPVIGNHEANDGDATNRYLNLTFGETLGDEARDRTPGAVNEGWKDVFRGVHSSAESALTELLSKTTLVGASAHSGVPSGTSRYFSADVGLIHFANIDLNKGIRATDDQFLWLEKDLAAVDRATTPWIFVTSHFPLFHATAWAHASASAAFYVGDDAERFATSGHEFVPAALCSGDAGGSTCERTVGEMLRDNAGVLSPLLHKYAVDVYNAGHVHDYCSTWPICFNASSGLSAVCANNTDNFVEPKGTVHVTEGNGGVPGVVGTSTLTNCSFDGWCRKHGTGGAYGRWVAHNASHLTYEHVQNNGGQVTDTWTIVQTGHGGMS